MKSYMEDLLRSKGLFKIILETKNTPLDSFKKDKWFRKIEQANGIILILISKVLKFHLEGVDTHIWWNHDYFILLIDFI